MYVRLVMDGFFFFGCKLGGVLIVSVSLRWAIRRSLTD